MRGTWLLLAVLTGCGGSDPEVASSFEIVGHADLGARGMNAALAIAGDTIYVGSRVDQKPILILDTETLAVVGEIPGSLGMSSRELRAVDNTLVVLNLQCSPDLHGCAATGRLTENIQLWDITNRRAPVLASTYNVTAGSPIFSRGPHEMYLRKDETRTLLHVSTPGAAPTYEIIDITNPAQPARLAGWQPRDGGLKPMGEDDILHSISLSGDGTRAYLSHQLSGLLVADIGSLPAVTLVTPPAAAYDWAPPGAMGPHSAVEIPGTHTLVVTEEVYPMPFGAGCPWGHLRIVDAEDPAAPKLLAEVKLAENDPALCATAPARTAYTAHNATVTSEVAFVTWYAGGIVAVDVRNPEKPKLVAQLRPEPLPSVLVEDPGLGGNPVEMWSYPIIKDGLVYVVDVRNGLYVLSYKGVGEQTVASETFLEGNSNL
jgi:hypothetical protein